MPYREADPREPAPTTTVVWWVELDGRCPAPVSLSRILSGDELERGAGYRFARDRDRFVVARAVLRMILGECLGVDPAEVPLSHGPFGKPEVPLGADGSRLFFSVAHSGGLAFFAVSRAAEVGIDVERVRPAVFESAWAPMWLSCEERMLLEQVADPWWRQQAMFDLWTRKEAFLKGLGCGHRLPLHTVRVPFGSAGAAHVAGAGGGGLDLGGWSVSSLNLGPGLSGALASCGGETRVVLRQFMVREGGVEPPRV